MISLILSRPFSIFKAGVPLSLNRLDDCEHIQLQSLAMLSAFNNPRALHLTPLEVQSLSDGKNLEWKKVVGEMEKITVFLSTDPIKCPYSTLLSTCQTPCAVSIFGVLVGVRYWHLCSKRFMGLRSL